MNKDEIARIHLKEQPAQKSLSMRKVYPVIYSFCYPFFHHFRGNFVEKRVDVLWKTERDDVLSSSRSVQVKSVSIRCLFELFAVGIQ